MNRIDRLLSIVKEKMRAKEGIIIISKSGGGEWKIYITYKTSKTIGGFLDVDDAIKAANMYKKAVLIIDDVPEEMEKSMREANEKRYREIMEELANIERRTKHGRTDEQTQTAASNEAGYPASGEAGLEPYMQHGIESGVGPAGCQHNDTGMQLFAWLYKD